MHLRGYVYFICSILSINLRPILIETFSICWKFWHFQTIYSINRVGLWFPKATSLSFIFYLFYLDFCCVKLETKFWSKTWDGNKTKKWIRLNESGIALLIEDLKCLPQLTLLIFSWLFSIALLMVTVKAVQKILILAWEWVPCLKSVQNIY